MAVIPHGVAAISMKSASRCSAKSKGKSALSKALGGFIDSAIESSHPSSIRAVPGCNRTEILI
jgi:hypothetical protein